MCCGRSIASPSRAQRPRGGCTRTTCSTSSRCGADRLTTGFSSSRAGRTRPSPTASDSPPPPHKLRRHVRWRPSRISLVAAVLLTAALAIRIAEVERTSYRPINDAGSYLTLASEIAHTGGYSTSHGPGTGAGGTRGPSAYFPPGFPYFLAAVDLIDGHTVSRDGAVHPARISQAVLGTVTVALVGLIALELFGPGVALVATLLAAVYPVLVELSGVLVAENLFTTLAMAAVYAILRARRSRRPYALIALTGALAGLATLTHVNGVVLLVPLLI